jgi:hypothetical protein
MKTLNWRHAVRAAVMGAALVSFAAAAAVPSFKQAAPAQGDPNFCLGKDDGSYRHPDCRVRYSCAGGLAEQVSCPEGQVFDASKNRGDDPAKSYCSAPEQLGTPNDCGGIAVGK